MSTDGPRESLGFATPPVTRQWSSRRERFKSTEFTIGDTRFSPSFLNIFFALYFVIGLGLMVLTPPFQTPDAFAHFDREVGIASGQVIASTNKGVSGSRIPSGVLSMEDTFSIMPFSSLTLVTSSEFRSGFDESWNTSPNFTVYATGGNIPFLYAPPVVGIWIGRLLSQRIMISYYLAEITNLLVFIALSRWALRQLPRRLAVPMAIFLITPMVAYLAVSVNPDSLLLALSLVFAAAIFRSGSLTNETPSPDSQNIDDVPSYQRHRYVEFLSSHAGYFSLFFMALEKPPLLLLGLLLPLSNVTTSVRRSLLTSTTFMAGTVLAYEAWAKLGERSSGPATINGVAAGRQLKLLLTNPTKDWSVLIQTLRANGWIYYKELIGGIGWLDGWFPSWFYKTFAVILIIALVSLVTVTRAHLGRFIWSLFVIASTIGAFMLTFYLIGTPYAQPVIYGIQGRYLLPLVPILIVVLGREVVGTPWRHRFSNVVTEYASVSLICLQVLVATEFAFVLLHRYWWA